MRCLECGKEYETIDQTIPAGMPYRRRVCSLKCWRGLAQKEPEKEYISSGPTRLRVWRKADE